MSRPLLTREASRAHDRALIDRGVPGVILMENAGRGACDVLLDRFADRLGSVVVVGGTGQNGGDAWVIARRLIARGVRPRAFLAGGRSAVARDARTNLVALEAVGGAVEAVDGELGPLAPALEGASLVVDGLFGTGLDRPIAGWRRDLVEALDAADAPVLALDLPSGVDADTGAVLGAAAAAEITVTFAADKRGLWQGRGRALGGEVVPVDIGVPPPESDDVLLSLTDAARWLRERASGAHKGTAGHVVVLAGEAGRTGAALLSGHGALRAGAGLVTLAAEADGARALDAKVYELMTAPLDALVDDALALAEGKKALVLGPGFGLTDARRAAARELARAIPCPTVLDADALTAIGEDLDRLTSAPPRVLTPHPGEAGRLLGISTAEVQSDRYAAARAIADRSGQVVVLKGEGTVVADATRLAVCPLGTPALGVAGTGDILAGAVAACVDPDADLFQTTCAAVLLHARAGELAARADRGLLAREVGDRIPDALREARLTR